MNGLAVTILIGQLPKLFGFKVGADDLIGNSPASSMVWRTERQSRPQQSGIAAIVLILVHQRLPKIPAVLITVVLSIAATTIFDLAARGVRLVAVLPKGFPPLTIPDVHLSDLAPLFAGALGIALASRADTISTRLRSPPAPGRKSAATRR